MSTKKQVIPDDIATTSFRDYIAKTGLTISAVSRDCGVDRTLLSKLYNGKTRRLTWPYTKKLSDATGITPKQLGYVF